MGEIVGLDLATLYRLTDELSGHATTIAGITVSKRVTMPGSPVQSACDQAVGAVHKAYGLIGKNIEAMATAAKYGLKTYEFMEKTNTDQLRRYSSGAGV